MWSDSAMPRVAAESVGRTTELAQLTAALDDVGAGRSIGLAVTGEAGIGKTHLFGELLEEAARRGCLVFSGSGSEFERDLPFGVWVQALDGYAGSLDARVLDELGVTDREALGAILPSLSGLVTASGSPLQDDRHRIHRAVRTLLDAVSDAQPVVLLLDDLHWSDDASIETIAALLRRPPEGAVLLALGFRTAKAPGRLASAIDRTGVDVIELRPLDAQDSAALIGPGVTESRAAAIFAESEGNPFYTLQMARAAKTPVRSTSADRVAADTGVPRLVAAAIVDELRALSPQALGLLNSAAIAGDPFDLDIAGVISELPAEQMLPTLDELLAERLVHATTMPRRFAFRHPLMRRAIYESTSAGWRLGAHARAAKALAQSGSPAAVAHHVERSAAPGDAAAITLLRNAGSASASRDPVGAVRWYRAALRLISPDDGPTRLDVLVRLAEALRATGDLEASAAQLREALEETPPEDLALRLRLTSAHANCQHFLGHHLLAETQLVSALDAFAQPGSPEAVAVLRDLTMGAFFTLDDDAMCRYAQEALDSARESGDHALVVATTCALAHATGIAGRTAEAVSAIEAAHALIDPLTDSELVPHLEALNRLTYGELAAGRFYDAIGHGERGAAIAKRTGGIAYAPLTLIARCMSLTMAGEYTAATEHLDEALEIAEVLANDYVTCSVLATGALACLIRGDIERGTELSERGASSVGDRRASRIAMTIRFALATARRVSGATAADTEHLVSDAGGWNLGPVTPLYAANAFDLITRAEVDAGRYDEAGSVAEAANRLAGAVELPIATALAERASARVALARGDEAGGADVALRSAAILKSLRLPVEEARSHAIAGGALVSADRARGLGLLREAEAVFDDRHAHRDRGDVRRTLRRLGVRVEPRAPRASSPGGLAALSAREKEIAELVTARMTNREIAADLFLSEKTVETHLRNIFAKLGVSSRVAVARAVEAQRKAG